MEDKPKKNKLEDLTEEERQKVVWIAMQAETIKEYVLDKKLSMKNMFELDDLLNESYDEFLPENNTEKLTDICFDFVKILNNAEQKLTLNISKYISLIIDGGYILTKNQIIECKSLISRIKEKIIPRLKRKSFNEAIKLLEGAIMGLEIKLAYDSGVEE